MEPVLKPQPRLLSLDDKILLNVARANVLSQITVSSLSSQKKTLFFARTINSFKSIISLGAESSW